jgi:recombination protein RecT
MENSNLAQIKTLLTRDDVKNKLSQMLGRNASSFISTVTMLSQSTSLKECEPASILSCAIAAASLNLQVSPSLGQACLVPYKDRKSGKTIAQFQIMKKGFIQLAQRSGVFKNINECIVFEGEYQIVDKLSGVFNLNGVKKSDKVIGYAAHFDLLNGFSKSLYMTKDEINKHAGRYSKTFKTGYGNWKDSFDEMALKTVVKLLISRYSPLSSDMQMSKAIEFDQAKINLSDDLEFSEVTYIDNQPEPLTEFSETPTAKID